MRKFSLPDMFGRSRVRNGDRPASRFLRDREGSVAIEFTALAIPFSLLVFAILESCLSFAGQQVLTNATEDVARQLRTGQEKADTMNEEKLRGLICERIEIVVAAGCPGLAVDLKAYDTFEQAAAESLQLTADGRILGSGVTPGKSTSKNMLRVIYRWPVITDFMRKSMSHLDDGTTLLFATVTWQNEPFDD